MQAVTLKKAVFYQKVLSILFIKKMNNTKFMHNHLVTYEEVSAKI